MENEELNFYRINAESKGILKMPGSPSSSLTLVTDAEGFYGGDQAYPVEYKFYDVKYVNGVPWFSAVEVLAIQDPIAQGYVQVDLTAADAEATHVLVVRECDDVIQQVLVEYENSAVSIYDGESGIQIEMADQVSPVEPTMNPLFTNRKSEPLLMKNVRVEGLTNGDFYMCQGDKESEFDDNKVNIFSSGEVMFSADTVIRIADFICPPGASLFYDNLGPDDAVISFVAIPVPELRYGVGVYSNSKWEKAMYIASSAFEVTDLTGQYNMINRAPFIGTAQKLVERFLLPPGSWRMTGGILMTLPLNHPLDFEGEELGNHYMQGG